jgi:hypothetical protein
VSSRYAAGWHHRWRLRWKKNLAAECKEIT